MSSEIIPVFDKATSSLSYIFVDSETLEAAIVDSVMDYDPKAARLSTASADALIAQVKERGLKVQWLLETHVHADHLSAARYIQGHVGGVIAIGDHIDQVQRNFSEIFDLGPDFPTDGMQFNHLFADNEEFAVGTIKARAIHTPGHTPACMAYLIGDSVFVGDTLFMPDYGTARCDFPGGDAHTLFRSIQKILALPPETRVFTAHDYQPGGRPVAWESTVADQRAHNIHVHAGITEDEFVAMREARDKTLSAPTLILPSVQINIRAGDLPAAAGNGKRYLKLPLDTL